MPRPSSVTSADPSSYSVTDTFCANPASPSSAALSMTSTSAWFGLTGSVYIPGRWRIGERSSRISMSSAL